MHTLGRFARLADAARNGHLAPRVATCHALTDIHAAQREFLDRSHTGTIVLSAVIGAQGALPEQEERP